MMAHIPGIESALMFLSSEIRIVAVAPKYLNFTTLSEDLVHIFILLFYPAFRQRDILMYLAYSVFSKPFCQHLCVFFKDFKLLCNILAYVPLIFYQIWFSWTFSNLNLK